MPAAAQSPQSVPPASTKPWFIDDEKFFSTFMDKLAGLAEDHKPLACDKLTAKMKPGKKAAFTPAKPGDILTIYGVSFGPTNPAVPTGQAAANVAPSTSTPAVSLGTLNMNAQDVLYAGASPGTPGLYQLNIRVPANLPDGDYPLSLTLGSFSTPAGAFLTVKN